jgi:hypothetical protein
MKLWKIELVSGPHYCGSMIEAVVLAESADEAYLLLMEDEGLVPHSRHGSRREHYLIKEEVLDVARVLLKEHDSC